MVGQEVAGVSGRFDFKPNLRPNLEAWNAVLRWKGGQPLPPTAVVVSSSDAKDVAMLLHHRFQLPSMSWWGRRSQESVAVLTSSQI